MNIKKIILEDIRKKGFTNSAEIIRKTNYSREYVNRFLRELTNSGQIVRVGKANQTKYYLPNKKPLLLSFKKTYTNKKLSEDIIYDEIKNRSDITKNLNSNLTNIYSYAFTEMMNNAIDHSNSKKILIETKKESNLSFVIEDQGIGIFNNIIKKYKLKDEMSAIQDLLKGKHTTLPEKHTGEGIFFTSKIADIFIIESGTKKLIINNLINDIFIQDKKHKQGTKIIFTINVKSKKSLNNLFKQFTDDDLSFSKTQIVVKLFQTDKEWVSRSEARRLLVNLEKFKKIVLDFDKVPTIGQGFADEIFRVWQNSHLDISMTPINMEENVEFMVSRAKKKKAV